MQVSEPNGGNSPGGAGSAPLRAPRPSSRRLRPWLPLAGALVIAGVWLWRAPLEDRIRERATLANDEPTPDVVASMIRQAADPPAALLAAWNSGKIVHREVAIDSLRRGPQEFLQLVQATLLGHR